ncbi:MULTISPECIES: trigger factor [Treponema]|uniref:Trigger factor n=1 Tax=Treponema succinifaciens (strain ATCC 33096 / DSM 2489 / 6091) TaxID=869209 RepID=F2NRW9_TRES6|nr:MULTISPECIES: trigger factor [Treponema]AEB14205.1 Trigger factor [Treponema succinifaciens DSM 2489]MDD6963188.1 trigger factor [Treponema succinifaciens]MDY5117950.1 trigger factor [Treponema succinifaciens]
MKVTKEISKLENSAVKLTATIAKEDVVSGYNKNISKYAKNVQLPGFRKGHVPVKVLEQKYGDSLKQEVLADLIDESLNQIFAEEESKDIRPLPYTQPRLDGDKLPEFSTDKDLTFSVVYDVFPSVEVKDFSKIEVKEPQVEIGEKELNEELKAIQERNAVVIDKKEGEPVEKDNIVTIDYKELDDSGAAIPGSEREGFVFTVGTGENIYKIDDEIVGMKKDETKEISKTYDAKEENKDLAGKTKKISVTVKAIKLRNLPALDDELAQDVSEKYKTLDDLKKDISKGLESAKNRKIAELKSQSLLEQLVEKNPIVLPKSMIQAEMESRWRMMAQQFQTTPEQLEKMISASGQSKENMLTQWTGDAEKMLKSRLIVDALIREKNIAVTPEEVEAEFAKIADESGSTIEEVKEHYEDARAKEYIIDEIKENKLYDELYKQVKVSKGDKVKFADLFKNNR